MRARINRQEMRQATLPIIGKIKTGYKAKSASGKDYPKSTDYFIATDKWAQLFHKEHGDKPKVIPVVFISDDDNVNCQERWEYRNDSGDLVAYGDGECFDVWVTKDKVYRQFCTEQYPEIMQQVKVKHPSKNEWKVTLTLRFMIPTIPVQGLWQLTTKGGESSIPQIIAAYDQIKAHRGTVNGTLFDLSVEFAKSQKPGDTSRYPVITLNANADPERIQQVSSKFIDNQKLLSK